MSGRRHHWLTRLYPSEWRARYGDEFDDLIEQETRGWRQMADVAKAAAAEQVSHLWREGVKAMKLYPGNIVVLGRKPTAMAPIAMSLCALATVLVVVAVSGAKREPDEGAAAHIFQMLIAGQLPFVAWFAIQWLKRDFKAGVAILGLQAVAVAAALFPIWYFGL